MSSAEVELRVPTEHPMVINARANAVALVVDSEEGKGKATNLLAGIAQVQSAAERERVTLVKPHNDLVKGINELFRTALAPLIEADSTLRRRVLEFNREQTRKAAEAAAAAEAERIRAEALLKEAEKAERAGEGAVAGELLERAVASEIGAKAAQAEAVLPSRTVRTDGGMSTVKKVWTFRLVSLDQVPVEYLALNETRVRDAIREAVRIWPGGGAPLALQIRGLEIVQDEQLAVRR